MCPIFLPDFNIRIFSTVAISDFMEIHPVGAALIRADRRTDVQNEANRRFLRLCERA
jgi:hypothetical protein